MIEANIHDINMTANIHEPHTSAHVSLIPIHTVNYGLMGIRSYRRIDPVDNQESDTRSAISANLTRNGKDMDLSNCNVLISISNIIYRHRCIVRGNTVIYPLNEDMTKDTGFFKFEFIVVHEDGREETVPNDGYFKLQIMDDIGKDGM